MLILLKNGGIAWNLYETHLLPYGDNGDNHKPTQPAALVTALNFLDAHEEWVERHPKEAARYFSHLQHTDTTGLNVGRVQMSIQAKYPALFDLVSVTMGTMQREIPKSKLIFSSQQWGTELGPELVLKTSVACADSTIECFLDFLQEGECDVTSENVRDLLLLANEQRVPALDTACTNTLGTGLNDETFGDTLEFALANDLHKLQWRCLKWASSWAAQEGQAWSKHSQVLSHGRSERFKAIMNLVPHFVLTQSTPMFTAGGNILLKVDYKPGVNTPPMRDARLLSFIDAIRQFVPLSSFELGQDMGPNFLSLLGSLVQRVDELTLHDQQVAKLDIPFSVAKLRLESMFELKSVNAGQVQQIECLGCEQLKREAITSSCPADKLTLVYYD